MFRGTPDGLGNGGWRTNATLEAKDQTLLHLEAGLANSTQHDTNTSNTTTHEQRNPATQHEAEEIRHHNIDSGQQVSLMWRITNITKNHAIPKEAVKTLQVSITRPGYSCRM